MEIKLLFSDQGQQGKGYCQDKGDIKFPNGSEVAVRQAGLGC